MIYIILDIQGDLYHIGYSGLSILYWIFRVIYIILDIQGATYHIGYSGCNISYSIFRVIYILLDNQGDLYYIEYSGWSILHSIFRVIYIILDIQGDPYYIGYSGWSMSYWIFRVIYIILDIQSDLPHYLSDKGLTGYHCESGRFFNFNVDVGIKGLNTGLNSYFFIDRFMFKKLSLLNFANIFKIRVIICLIFKRFYDFNISEFIDFIDLFHISVLIFTKIHIAKCWV